MKSALLRISQLFSVAFLWMLHPHSRAAEPAGELIAKGDEHAKCFRTSQALKYYLPAEKQAPKDPKLLARISREYRHLMTDAAAQGTKERLGQIAISYANRATEAGPDDPEAHLAVAICYGKLQPYMGNRERISASKLIRQEADCTLRLDPRSDLGWHILGCWYKTLADVSSVKRALAKVTYGELPPATNEDAIRCFEKAIALNPNRLMHYIELGRTYAQMGKKAEAKRYLTKGLAMQETEKDDPETKRLGREALEKL